MLKRSLHRLLGQVYLQVECAFPERVLNLCGARNLSFWDLQWQSPVLFTCRMSRRDYRALRQMAEKLECRLTVVRREGAPYFLRRFRRRQTLLAGAVLCALGLFLGSFFIWDFVVEGNETVPTERILRALEQSGVGLGTFGLTLNGEEIRNRVLLEVPELSWIAVNVSGCRATVQVRERVLPPKRVDERAPTNVVARRAGLVLEVQALDGVACVLKGDSVAEGQLLISGVADTDTFGARMLPGQGRVQARTWHTLRTNVDLTAAEKRYTGREKRGISLIFGTRRIKLFSNSSIQGRNYDKISSRTPWSLLGIPLPVTLVVERFRFYETVQTELEAETAERMAEQLLRERLCAAVEPYGSVVSTLCSARRRGDTLEVTLRAECREEIGKTMPIYREENKDVTV